MQAQVLTVQGISCGHCEKVIQKALSSLPGIGLVEVHITNRQIKVTYDETISDLRIIGGTLEGAGYPIGVEDRPVLKNAGRSSCCGSRNS